MTDLASLARRCFETYQTRDREALEGLLADDFTFTSPYDDHIDRATYFVRCWPNAGTFDSVVRWTDEAGRIGYGPCQGIWYDAFQRLMKERGHGR